MFEIRPDDLSGEAIRALLAYHLAQSRLNSPPGTAFALDLSGLIVPEVTVWSVHDGDALVGVGALKMLDGDAAELKSMRTHPNHLRRGVASAMLRFLVAEARRRGVRHLHLETGSAPAFGPAIALYLSHGFAEGGPFANYRDNGFSRFFHRTP